MEKDYGGEYALTSVFIEFAIYENYSETDFININ